MGTRYAEIFAALDAGFEPHEIRHRPGQGGKQLSYITASTVANRLDNVVGPE